jgi:acyl-CoA synthetase (AMP-forming)/AMP-acid ligase II
VTLLAPTMLNDLLEARRCGREPLPALQTLYSASPMPEALRSIAVRPDPGAGLWRDRMRRPRLHAACAPACARRTSRWFAACARPASRWWVRRAGGQAGRKRMRRRQAGEIVIRSAALMSGYWNNHPATLGRCEADTCTPATWANGTTKALSLWSTGSGHDRIRRRECLFARGGRR